MKRVLLASLATIGFAACTSSPTYTNQNTEFRNPAGLSGESSALSAEVAIASANVAIDIVSGSFDGSKVMSGAIVDAFAHASTAAKELAIIGWGASKDSGAIAVASIRDVSELVGRGSRSVMTTSGQIFEGSVNGSKSAVAVSVKIEGKLGDASVWIGGRLVGFVRHSSVVASNAARWSGDAASAAGDWSMNTAGELYLSSKTLIGSVLDKSGRAISFIVDKTGQILAISAETSVAIIHGSSQSSMDLAHNVKNGLKSSGQFINAKLTSSAEKTAYVLTWSENGVSRVSRMLTMSIRELLESRPEVRPPSSSY